MTTNHNSLFEAFISLMMMLTALFSWKAKHESRATREKLDKLIAIKEAAAFTKGREEGRAESKAEVK